MVASFNVDHGDLDEAIAAFAQARELDTTEDPQLLLGYADALVIAKRYDEASKLIDQMKVPAHQLVVRGRIELERGDPAAALKLFDEGMRLWPNNAVARYYAAIAAERLGDFDARDRGVSLCDADRRHGDRRVSEAGAPPGWPRVAPKRR